MSTQIVTNVHGNFICNSQKLETTQTSINRCVDIQTVVKPQFSNSSPLRWRGILNHWTTRKALTHLLIVAMEYYSAIISNKLLIYTIVCINIKISCMEKTGPSPNSV